MEFLYLVLLFIALFMDKDSVYAVGIGVDGKMIQRKAIVFDVKNTPFTQDRIDAIVKYMRFGGWFNNDTRSKHYFLKGDLICAKDALQSAMPILESVIRIDLKDDMIRLIDFAEKNGIELFWGGY